MPPPEQIITVTDMTTLDKITIATLIVQTLTTVVLAVITYFQMKLAGLSVKSMENSIKAGFLPILMISLIKYSSTEKTLDIEFTNCGKGIALTPKILFPGHDDVVSISLDVGEKGNSTIEYGTDFILNKCTEGERKITIEYFDVFGRKVSTVADLIEMNDLGTDANKRGVGWKSWRPIIPK